MKKILHGLLLVGLHSMTLVLLTSTAIKRVNDSDLVYYQLKQLGTTTLESPKITVVPKGAYLDIIEEGCSSNISRSSHAGITKEFVLKGALNFPDKAIVTSVVTWVGETPYRCFQRGRVYMIELSMI